MEMMKIAQYEYIAGRDYENRAIFTFSRTLFRIKMEQYSQFIQQIKSTLFLFELYIDVMIISNQLKCR